MNFKCLTGVVLLVSSTLVAQASEQNPAVAAQRQVVAVRADKPPVIDGVLDDSVWQNAPETTEFTQRDPEEGKPASEKTIVKVVYDEDAIYFAARMHDSQAVTARLGRRDSAPESDWFRVYLDPQLDRRSGAAFWVNAANVQRDTILYNDSWDDPSWDAVWESATKIDAEGWTAEIRIPYSQLRFPPRDKHVWGVNFIRQITSRKEQDRLVHVPKTESGFVSRFADLIGIENIAPKRALEILPYVVGRADLSTEVVEQDPFNESAEARADVGVDLKYTLTSNLTLTGTINPDFGQVEVDPARLNLTEFELFFPEKRPFFIEGSNLFAFGQGGSNHNFGFNYGSPRFFYSRRVGRAPQGMGRFRYDYVDAPQETTILAAAKLTGKTASGWTVAALDAVTEEEEADFRIDDGPTDSTTVEPMTNYFVSRIAKDLGTRGRLGLLATSTNRSLDSDTTFLRENAYFGGIDGYWGFGKRDVILEWVLAGTRVDGSTQAISATQNSSSRYYGRPDADHVEFDPTRTSLDGFGGRVMLAKQTGKWKYNLQAQSYSPGFEVNDLGFNTRSDIHATHAVILYNNEEVRKNVRERSWWLGKYQNWNFDGDLIANGFYGNGYIEFTSDRYIFVNGGPYFERYDDRDTRGGPLVKRSGGVELGGGFGLAGRKKLFYEVWFNRADNEDGGSDSSIGGLLGFRPRPNLTLQLTPSLYSGHEFAQYVTTIRGDATATHTFNNRYVYADLDQKTLEIGTRVDWTLNSKLSFQLYLQPFIATGDYYHFKELERPSSRDFAQYGVDRGTIEGDGDVVIDPDGIGEAKAFSLDNPDFNFRSLRGSAVVRWEFRPGSALFVVWNENRRDADSNGDLRPSRDFSALADGESDDVFLVKMSYWLPL